MDVTNLRLYLNRLTLKKSSKIYQILAPNSDANGQHPDLTGKASLRQDWHRAERKENATFQIESNKYLLKSAG